MEIWNLEIWNLEIWNLETWKSMEIPLLWGILCTCSKGFKGPLEHLTLLLEQSIFLLIYSSMHLYQSDPVRQTMVGK